MNRDESLKCFQKAKEYYNSNQFEQALKFFNKSYKLETSDLTLQYMKKCQEKIANGASSSDQNGNHGNGSSATLRDERRTSTPGSLGVTPSEPVPEDVQRILNLKDFYEILGVTKTSTEEEIKKSYRKLALKFHPDKNKAPRSDEAFKKIAQAYDCLTNAEKKRLYDQYGSEDPDQHYRHYRQHYHDDVSPEDIFDMFFSNFGMQPQGGRRTRTYYYSTGGGNRGGNGQRQQQQQGGLWSLIQFLPLLLIFATSLIFNISREEPAYSLNQSYKYPHTRTSDVGFQYYVDKDFSSNIASNNRKLREVEREVNVNMINRLQEQCTNARTLKRQLENRAKYYKGNQAESLMKQAASVDLGSCKTIEDVYQKRPDLFRGYYYY